MSLSIPVTPPGGRAPVRHPAQPALPTWMEALRARRRTPWQLAGLVLSALAHLVMVASLVFATPLLVRAVAHRGPAVCDLTHLSVKQALTGTVCGRRMFDVTIAEQGGHGTGRSHSAGVRSGEIAR